MPHMIFGRDDNTILSCLFNCRVNNNTITSNSATVYLDEDKELITATTFFSLLIEGETEVEIEAIDIANQEILAIELTILK